MYLSRLILNPTNRTVQRELSDCQLLHRRVMSGFPRVGGDGDARQSLGVLYHLDTNWRTGLVSLLIQSLVPPNWLGLPPGYLSDTGSNLSNSDCKRVDEQYARLQNGSTLRFRLRANPARKIDTHTGEDGRRRNGRRVELQSEEEQVNWLRRKGEQHGFAVLAVRVNLDVADVRASPEGKAVGWRATDDGASTAVKRLTFGSVVFDGKLRITDASAFRAALERGIGSGKAYGFGLLSVGPV